MYLRRKTEAGGEPRLVHTVRGVGYVLRATGRQPRVTGRSGRLPALPLRSRLALLVAAAVAVAVAAVRDGLLVHRAREADTTSSTSRCAATTASTPASIVDQVSSPGSDSPADRARAATRFDADRPGRRPATARAASSLGRARCEVDGRRHGGGRARADRAVHTVDAASTATGTDYRVLTTRPCEGTGRRGVAWPARSPRSTESPLNDLALILAPRRRRRRLGARRGRALASPAPGCAPSTGSPRPSSTSPAPRTSSVRIPVEGRGRDRPAVALLQLDDRRARLLPGPAAAADRGRRARAAHPADLAAHQHRTARAQRGDGPADPARGPQGAAGLGEGADDANWPRSSATCRSCPGPTRRRAVPACRSSRCTRSSRRALERARLRGPELTITARAGALVRARRSRPRWSARWSTCWTTR